MLWFAVEITEGGTPQKGTFCAFINGGGFRRRAEELLLKSSGPAS